MPEHPDQLSPADPLLALNDAAAALATYDAAVRLGVLDRIDREPATVEEVSFSCGLSVSGTRLLLGALHALRLVKSTSQGRFHPAVSGLASAHPLLEAWRNLGDAIKAGGPALTTHLAEAGQPTHASAIRQLHRLVLPPQTEPPRPNDPKGCGP